MSSVWIKAPPLSCKGRLILPVGVDKHHYIALCGDYIWKYEVDDDSWSKIMNAGDVIEDWNVGDHTAAALSKDKKDLYIYIGLYVQAKLIHINLQNKVHETFDIERYSGYLMKIVMIDNALNIIGGSNSNMHLKWNEKGNQLNGEIVMYDEAVISGHGLIYTNNSKKHLLLFGGYDYNKMKYLDYGLGFNFETQKWNKLPTQLPRKWRISCTLAIRNQFVFIFGGHYNGNYSNDIHIYNIKNHTIRLSKIKLPSASIWKCVTINDELKDEMIVFGFVRHVWKIASIDNYLFPPQYLLKIMHLYYLNESIHVLDNQKGHIHWKINTLDLL